MKNDQGFADLIYEYFVVRFHFQYYKYGDSLPKLEALCSQFSVSSITIKSAFKRLQKEGYISRSHGRSARVLFQQTGKELNEYAVHFFSKRLKI
ncbi:GntR family transcriptional regulator, partial [Romboutsia ilealis]|nr:GntR family transcriptional regulator [Romboutsia ilealis]